MMRTTIGLSFILVLGGVYACSSKSTDDGKGTGGNGAIVGGTGTGGSSGSGNGAGTTNVSGGKAATGGVTGTGGLSNGACTDETITCVDATSAQGCDPTTGVVDTVNCVEYYKELGFVSPGCSADATTGEEGCDVTAVTDTACQTGAQVFARCEGATTDEQVFNIYVNCFQNNMDGHAVITCFNGFGTAATITANKCLQAEEACFPGAGGAGPVDPAGGAGGAP